MKHCLIFPIIFFSTLAVCQDHKLEKLWETDSIIAVPESVLYHAKNNMLYVSLIVGSPWESDGKGGVGKLSPAGNKYDSTWITGLNGPKGMGMMGDRLYVADMGTVVVIDIPKGKIEKKIVIDSAKGLNDITISDKNIVYVSDSRGAKIWRIENDIATLYLDTVRGVNGLKAIGDDLYIGAGRTFMKADAKKQITKIAEVAQGIDGIEPVGNGDFLLTAWAGYIWYVSASGKVETLLETHPQKKNSADLGYDPEKKILYVPTFNARTVVAYSLR